MLGSNSTCTYFFVFALTYLVDHMSGIVLHQEDLRWRKPQIATLCHRFSQNANTQLSCVINTSTLFHSPAHYSVFQFVCVSVCHPCQRCSSCTVIMTSVWRSITNALSNNLLWFDHSVVGSISMKSHLRVIKYGTFVSSYMSPLQPIMLFMLMICR